MEWFWRREREKEEERKMAGDMPFLRKDIGLFLVLYFLFIYICIDTMLKLQILRMLDWWLQRENNIFALSFFVIFVLTI